MTPYVDVVGIFDSNGNQKFTQARSMRIQVTRTARTAQHPLETGASVVDHRIMLPIEAQLLVILQAKDYRNGYSQLQSSFNAGEILNVHCKAGVFNNMCIADMPHEETPDMIDIIQVAVKLVETQFFRSQAQAISKPARSRSASTTRRGEQTPQRSSVAFQLFGK